MTLCIVTGRGCVCQPGEAMWCPEYKPDWYVRCLMRAIEELRAELASLEQQKARLQNGLEREMNLVIKYGDRAEAAEAEVARLKSK